MGPHPASRYPHLSAVKSGLLIYCTHFKLPALSGVSPSTGGDFATSSRGQWECLHSPETPHAGRSNKSIPGTMFTRRLLSVGIAGSRVLTRSSARSRVFQTSARQLVQIGDAIPHVELLENSPGNKVSIAKELKGRGLIIGVPAAFSKLPRNISHKRLWFLNKCTGPSCSEKHVPGYINFGGLKDAGDVFVVSVNDPFVYVRSTDFHNRGLRQLTYSSMKAWAESLDPDKKSSVSMNFKPTWPHGTKTDQIRFLGDPHATFTNALDLAFDATAIFGQPRSKRYALVIKDGKVKEAHVEPDNTGVNGKLLPEDSWRMRLMLDTVSVVDKVLGK